MQKYKATSKTAVLTDTANLTPDGYASIELVNIGTDDAVVNNNIPLPSGSSWTWRNEPNISIDESTGVVFKGAHPDKRVLVMKFYYE